jgi:hypothetical protein
MYYNPTGNISQESAGPEIPEPAHPRKLTVDNPFPLSYAEITILYGAISL